MCSSSSVAMTLQASQSLLHIILTMCYVLGQSYMIGLSRPGLLQLLTMCSVIGLDSKWDLNGYHFPTLLFSCTDACNTGKVGALMVMSKEDGPTVQLAIQVVRWQAPCTNPSCAHKILYHT